MNQKLLRILPKIDVLTDNAVTELGSPAEATAAVTEAARVVIQTLREEILEGKRKELPDDKELIDMVKNEYKIKMQHNLRPVINATGITLHTNLGRSVLSKEAGAAVMEIACSYNTLEYQLEKGSRGSRYSHVNGLLKQLCHCEDSLVVNNNAAAVMLILNTIGKGGNVIISRGELVEIGGSFRIPEIMEMSGCTLKEIGTTNKTHVADYERAVDEETTALLKVHTSNFKMTGFTESVSLKELIRVGGEKGIPVLYDMGSGSILSMNHIKGVDEPNVCEALASGADIVCFSGDKLLGGPQAGIIAGKKDYIDAMKANPLTRALRVDKMTFAALEVTLRQYLLGNARETIPTLHMLSMTGEELYKKYKNLDEWLEDVPGLNKSYLETASPAGGGSIPGVMFDSVCIAVSFSGVSASELEYKLRMLPHPVVARIHENQVLLDVRTIQEEEFELVRDGFLQIREQTEA